MHTCISYMLSDFSAIYIQFHGGTPCIFLVRLWRRTRSSSERRGWVLWRFPYFLRCLLLFKGRKHRSVCVFLFTVNRTSSLVCWRHWHSSIMKLDIWRSWMKFIEKHNNCQFLRCQSQAGGEVRPQGPGSGLAARPGRSLRNRFRFCCPIHWHHTALGSGTGRDSKSLFRWYMSF